MKEIRLTDTITSIDFEERCGEDIAKFINDSLKIRNKSNHSSIKSVDGEYSIDTYVNYFANYTIPIYSFTTSSKIKVFHRDFDIELRVTLSDFLIRDKQCITTIRNFYQSYGIIIDEELKDLKFTL